jgi:3-oxoacyl-[acyl-carrier-protein] synthase-1
VTPASGIRVVAVGARGPLGLRASQVAMCARARKLEPRGCGVLDGRGRRVGICRTPGLADDLHGYARLVELAAPALAEAAAAGAREATPLILAVPEPGRADDDARLGGDVLAELAARARVAIDSARSQVVRAGHAGFAIALEAAAGLFSGALGAPPPFALIGAVDGHFHPGLLGAIDREHRLHSPDTEDGFVPSEGAAFLLLAPPRGAAEPTPAHALIGAAATGREETIVTGEPNIARAMTDLVHALVRAPGAPVDWVMTDVNGERHRVREWSMVEARVPFGEHAPRERLPDALGELGAASGAMAAAIMCVYLRAGCASGRSALIALASDGPERGAFRIEAPRQ